MTPRIAPRGLARAGFITLAVVLAIFAIPATRGSALLLPALFAVGIGGVLLALKRESPALSRAAGGVFAAYMLSLIVLFVLQSPFTLGKNGSFASGDAFEWARPLFEAELQALPVVLVVGAAVAAWPWSGNPGRGVIVAGLVLLGAFFTFDWLSTPTDFDTVTGATFFARVASWLMSLAALAVLTGVALLVRPPSDDGDAEPQAVADGRS